MLLGTGTALSRRAVLGGLGGLALVPAVAAAPRAAGRAEIVGSGPSTGWIDFRLHREALIILPATLNGRPARVLIDSGVTHVIVNDSFARAAGLKRTGAATIGAVAGRTKGSVLSGVEVLMGGLRVRTDQAIGTDLSGVEQASGQGVDLILGRDLFDHLTVDMHFPNRKIAFHRPGSFRAPDGARAVPARLLGNGLRALPLSLHGLPPVQATFDLGARAPLLLSERYARQHGLMQGRRVSTVPSTGVAGTTVAQIFATERVGFAGLELGGVPATVPRVWQNDAKGIDSPVYVGMGLLSRFRIVTDYRSDRIWFVPDGDTVTRPFRKDRSGLRTVLEGDRLRVSHVSAGSPAAAAGWREGERIAAIDGTSVGAGYYDSAGYGWEYGEPGRAVVLRLEDGSERRLVLADYY